MTTQLHECLGDILHLTGQYTEARAAFQTVLTYVPKIEAIWQARLYYKSGNTWRLQYHYEEALRVYGLAETALGPELVESHLEWWQEWIQIQLERLRTYYWVDRWPEMAELAEKARSAVEQHGTPVQRANFLLSLVLMNLRRDRYIVSEETLSLARAALAINQEFETLSETREAPFELGFVLLFHGDLTEAEKHLLAALRLAERTGDVKHQTRCLTYLTVTYRKQDEVEKVKDYISRSLTAATVADMSAYIGTAKANLAWVAWREGNLAEAEVQGQVALKLWEQLALVYPFHWLALWPLIGVALAQDQVSTAINYARPLLEPRQQRLPDALTGVVEEALQAWASDQPEIAKLHLSRALEIAQKMKYL